MSPWLMPRPVPTSALEPYGVGSPRAAYRLIESDRVWFDSIPKALIS